MHKSCFSFCCVFFFKAISIFSDEMCPIIDVHKQIWEILTSTSDLCFSLSFPSPQGSHPAVPDFPQGCFWGSFWSLSSSLHFPLPSAPLAAFQAEPVQASREQKKVHFSVAMRVNSFISLQQSSVGPLLPVFSSIVGNVTDPKWKKNKSSLANVEHLADLRQHSQTPDSLILEYMMIFILP